jgi:hypothetical protein
MIERNQAAVFAANPSLLSQLGRFFGLCASHGAVCGAPIFPCDAILQHKIAARPLRSVKAS